MNKSHLVEEELLVTMRDTLKHRGPDGKGLYISNDKLVGLGHRRLALMDLSDKGTQPMSNENKTIWATVNGEIYNYPQLKEELQAKGHQFMSSSDSEVVIHAYEEWGEGLFSHLNGMFAFGIWDDNKKRLVLARDRFGIKPLYYFQDSSSFIFASEIKAIIEDPQVPRRLDHKSVCDYLTYRYVPCPATIWKDVKKLKPGHYMIIDLEGNVQLKKYWSLEYGNNNGDPNKLISDINALLLDSVSSHTMSDVSVGSFLSGGYDSSALVSYLSKLKHPIHSFSIGFENWNNSEHQFAEIVANKFEANHESVILQRSGLDLVEKLAYYYDEPLADISIVPTYEVSSLASKKVKAVLSGEGADELFGGYTWYKSMRQANSDTGFFSGIFSKFSGSNKAATLEHYASAMEMGSYDSRALADILDPDLHAFIPKNPHWYYNSQYSKGLSPVKSLQALDMKCFMSELVLTKIDRASMANSLEVRVPFLDHRLVQYMFNLKESTYYKPDIKKYLLYENIKNDLPASILNREKQGFVGPDHYYQDYSWYGEVILDGQLIGDRIIRRETTEKWLKQKDHWRLWKLAVLELWYKRWN